MENIKGMVSVIIPVYQSGVHLKKCIESILEQTYKNTEIILVDDGSDDGSEELCDSYSQEYNNVFAIHQKNRGVSYARNRGVSYAKGEYVLFVDSDDYIDRDYLENALGIFESQNVDMYLCGYQNVKKEGKIKEKRYYPGVRNAVWKYDDIDSIVLRLFVSTALHAIGTKVYKRDIIRENKIKFKEKWKYYEDIYFCLEYLSYCKKIYTQNTVMYYYQIDVPGSLSKQYSNREYEVLYDTYKLLFKLAKLHQKDLESGRLFYKLYLSKIQCFLNLKMQEQKRYTPNIRRLYKRISEDTFYKRAIFCFHNDKNMEYLCIKNKFFLGAYLIRKYQLHEVKTC